MSIKINILGDFCSIGRLDSSSNYNSDAWLGDLQVYFNSADLNVVNLECPLTTSTHKIKKSGPYLKAKPESIKIIKQAGINMVTLANNHIMDYGEEGLRQTIELLLENKIDFVGAGLNISQARKVRYITINNVRIAFINFTQTEFSIADTDNAGAFPIDIIENYQQIIEAKLSSDYQFVIIHGGVEMYHFPTPRFQKLYRFYASLGVSAVIGHHSHVISGYEVYMGVPIFYSLGNFVFDEKGMGDDWHTGLMVSFTLGIDLTFELVKFYANAGSKLKISLTPIQSAEVLTKEIVGMEWEKRISNPDTKRRLFNGLFNTPRLGRFAIKHFPGYFSHNISSAQYSMLCNDSTYEQLVSVMKEHNNIK